LGAWLPMNYRLYSKIPDLQFRTKCMLCAGNRIDSMSHLLDCPSLRTEQSELISNTQSILRKWDFPLVNIRCSPKSHITNKWMVAGRNLIGLNLSSDRLAVLGNEFYHVNYHKQSMSARLFLQQCEKVRSQPLLRNLPHSLLHILSTDLQLSVEGISNALSNHPDLFPDWFSKNAEDTWFGARKFGLDQDFSGSNVYFNLIHESKEFAEQLLTRLLKCLESQQPTRALIVFPTSWSLMNHILFLPLLTLKWDPNVSVILALNKESMLIDPISWTTFNVKIREWSHQAGVATQVNGRTDSLFKERRNPDRPARVRPSAPPDIETTPYPFFVPLAVGRINLGIEVPLETKKLLSKIERHPPQAALLGILPNQLRALLINHDKREDALTDLSLSMFWNGYHIWRTRKHLVAAFYKSSAPDEWRRDYKEKKRQKRKKLRSCSVPFHYLERWCDMSGQLRRVCGCSDPKVEKKEMDSMDIRNFFKKPKIAPRSSIIKKFIAVPSRTDLIRESQDRSKKWKNKS
jgi:hypothetical protein